jgi:hypothetical protein
MFLVVLLLALRCYFPPSYYSHCKHEFLSVFRADNASSSTTDRNVILPKTYVLEAAAICKLRVLFIVAGEQVTKYVRIVSVR